MWQENPRYLPAEAYQCHYNTFSNTLDESGKDKIVLWRDGEVWGSAIVRTPVVPESSEALPTVSPEDKYLNQIICVIFVSTCDVGSQHQRKCFCTWEQRFIRSGIFQNTSTDGVLKQYIMHGYTIHPVVPTKPRHHMLMLKHSFMKCKTCLRYVCYRE